MHICRKNTISFGVSYITLGSHAVVVQGQLDVYEQSLHKIFGVPPLWLSFPGYIPHFPVAMVLQERLDFPAVAVAAPYGMD